MKSSPPSLFFMQAREAQREAVTGPKPLTNRAAECGPAFSSPDEGRRLQVFLSAGRGEPGHPLGKVLQPNPVHPPPSPGLLDPRGDGMRYPKPGPSIDPSRPESGLEFAERGAASLALSPLRRVHVASVKGPGVYAPPIPALCWHRPRAGTGSTGARG